MQWKGLFGLVRETVHGWFSGQSFQFGAALAFYGAFALAPTLVIAIAVAGIIFGEEAAAGQLAKSLEVALGPTVAAAIADTLAYVHLTSTGWIATMVGLSLVMFAATGMFIQLQGALNSIWGVRAKPGRSLWAMVRSRFFAIVLVLGLGALLLLLLIANAAISTMRAFLPESSWARDLHLWGGMNWLLLIGLLTLLFAMIYKLLPYVIISWRDVWIGAVITAMFFVLGNYLIGYVLGRMAPAFAYWAASSLVVLMLWVYYSSQVLLFGAEFTKNFSNRFGDPARPADYAMFVPGKPRAAQQAVATNSEPSQTIARSPS